MNPVLLERMRELQKEKESKTCSICCGNLTLKNIVNPECGHSTCKDCFWRWAKDKNTCPFCRTSLLKNDQDAKDIQQMRDLLHHRSNIVREVEESYEEHDELISTNNILKKKKKTLETYLTILEKQGLEEKERLDNLRKANSGTYQTYRYFQEQQRKERELYRIHRPFWRSCRNLHNCLFKKICKDINSLGFKRWYPLSDGQKCTLPLLSKLDIVWEMNTTRKKRLDFRFDRDNNYGLALNLLENLFIEPVPSVISEEEYDILNETVWNWQLLMDYNQTWHRETPPPIFRTDNLINNYQDDIEEIN